VQEVRGETQLDAIAELVADRDAAGLLLVERAFMIAGWSVSRTEP